MDELRPNEDEQQRKKEKPPHRALAEGASGSVWGLCGGGEA